MCGGAQCTDHRGENPHITRQPPNFVSKKTDPEGTGFPQNSSTLWHGQDWEAWPQPPVSMHSSFSQQADWPDWTSFLLSPPCSDTSHGLHLGHREDPRPAPATPEPTALKSLPAHTHLSPDLRMGRARCNGGGRERERRTTPENSRLHREAAHPAKLFPAAGLGVTWPGNQCPFPSP